MFLFVKKRKEESLRPLTEKEIQEKLYGRYSEKASVDETEDGREGTDKSVQDLFVPPHEVKNEQPVLQTGEVSRISDSRQVSSDVWKAIQAKASSLSSLRFPRWTWPPLPVMKKPRWVEKLERIPISYVAAAFLVLVLLFVGVRAVAQGVFRFWPRAGDRSFPFGLDWSGESLKSEAVPTPIASSRKLSERRELSGPSVKTEGLTQASRRFYTIQVAVYDAASYAEKLVARFLAKKVDAFYRPVRTSRGKVRYQVFIGRFDQYGQAQSELSRYRKLNLLAEFGDSFVRPLVE